MTSITRRLEFDYGHRVLGHEGKCAHLHGHRGVVLITVDSFALDKIGRVIDFGQVKKVVGQWIDDNLDHNFLCHPEDPLLNLVFDECEKTKHQKIFNGKNPFVMPEGENPTAENLARLIYFKSKELLEGGGISVRRVRFYETPNSYADFSIP